MKPTIKMTGLRELDAALAQFKKSTARGVAQRALKRAAEPVLLEAQRHVPVHLGDLRDSLHITTKKPVGHASKAAFREAMRAGATRAQAGAAQRAYNRDNPGGFAEVFIVAGRLAQAWPAEVGTANQSPTPFLRPAMLTAGEEALALIGDELRIEIEKTAARVARKAR